MKWFDSLNSWTLDYQLRVKAFFTPSEYTREMFSTVSRGWVAWQVFLIGINLASSILHLFQSNWLIAFLYFLVAALFTLVASHELVMNMARRTIDNLFAICREQQKTMHAMIDDFEMASGVPLSRNTEEFD